MFRRASTPSVIKIPATRVATEDLGKRVVANVVMLGALNGVEPVVSRESMEKAVLDSAPKGTEELNLKALRRGYELGEAGAGNSVKQGRRRVARLRRTTRDRLYSPRRLASPSSPPLRRIWMRLFEYESKRILQSVGVPLPQGRLVASPEEARQAAAEIGKPVVLKVQILATGRGKAGGVRFADTPEQAETVAREMLGMQIKGYVVEQLLVEEKLEIAQELYVAATYEERTKGRLMMASESGGMDINEVAETDPDRDQEGEHGRLDWHAALPGQGAVLWAEPFRQDGLGGAGGLPEAVGRLRHLRRDSGGDQPTGGHERRPGGGGGRPHRDRGRRPVPAAG